MATSCRVGVNPSADHRKRGASSGCHQRGLAHSHDAINHPHRRATPVMTQAKGQSRRTIISLFCFIHAITSDHAWSTSQRQRSRWVDSSPLLFFPHFPANSVQKQVGVYLPNSPFASRHSQHTDPGVSTTKNKIKGKENICRGVA